MNQQQAEQNLSKLAKKSTPSKHLTVINGKIIFKSSDILRALGVDVIG